MQLFRGYVDKNETPDVGSYIEAFSKDFEALFKIHNFTIHRPQISSEMRFKISSAKEKALKEQILKQDSDASEEEDEDEDEDEEEKKDEGPKRIEKAKIESEVVHDGNTDNVAYYKNVFLTLHKNVIPLNMYLLKMVFSQNTNRRIQNKAIDILIDNFSQRRYFQQEIVKVELLISDVDQEIYERYKDQYERIEKILNHLILDDLEYLLLKNYEKDKYKNRVKDATIIIKNTKSTLKRELNDKNRYEVISRVKKSQNILREFGVHSLLLEVMQQIYYRHNDHYQLFIAILNFLEYFCWENKLNQDALLPHISYLLSLNQWDLDSPSLISEILKPYRETEYGNKFFKFIVERIVQRNLTNAHLFNFLSVMVSAKGNQYDTKMYILNKIIKQPKLREVMMDTEKAHKKVEVIEIYLKKRRTMNENMLLQEKEHLDAHIALMNLYAKLSTN